MLRRRLGILLFLPLCFQLGLAARAIACVNGRVDGAKTAMSNAPSMPGMDMPAPSSTPSNPTECQPLAACAPAVIAPTLPTMPASASVPIDVVTLVVLTPSSWRMLPELPPPRA